MPLKAWVKNALDNVIRECMNEPGLEFVWVGGDAVDPLEQAQTLQILVGAGIKTREEAGASDRQRQQQRRPPGPRRVRRCATPCKRKPLRFRDLEQKENISLTAYAGRGIVSYSGDGAGGDNAAAANPPSQISPISDAPAPNGRVRLLLPEPACPLSTCSCRSPRSISIDAS